MPALSRRIRLAGGLSAGLALVGGGAFAAAQPFSADIGTSDVVAAGAGVRPATAPDLLADDRLIAGDLPAERRPSLPSPTAAARLRAAIREAAGPVYVADQGERVTVERIRAYLERKGSPLAPHADAFVEAGVAHDVDPRLVVAISAIESTFGKHQLGHNAWGWGGSNLQRWPDWDTAIREYTAALGEKYDTHNVDAAFAKRYVPPNWRHWLDVVHAVMNEI